MPKVNVPSEMYEKAQELARRAGYASADEFVVHLLETAVARAGETDQDADVLERLRGLGYIS